MSGRCKLCLMGAGGEDTQNRVGSERDESGGFGGGEYDQMPYSLKLLFSVGVHSQHAMIPTSYISPCFLCVALLSLIFTSVVRLHA